MKNIFQRRLQKLRVRGKHLLYWPRLRIVLPFIFTGIYLIQVLQFSLTKNSTQNVVQMYEPPSFQSVPEYEVNEETMRRMLELRRKLERATPGLPVMEAGRTQRPVTRGILSENSSPPPTTTTPLLRKQSEELSHFQPVLTQAQRQALFIALLKIRSVAEDYGFTWMLMYGTLLGSWRHHNIIPWDDDVDIFMSYKQKERIMEAFSKLRPEFDFLEVGSRLKFWAANGTESPPAIGWKWPFVDINFYSENRTHVWDVSILADFGEYSYLFGRSNIFPLHIRPLGRYFFPAPRDSLKIVRRSYMGSGLQLCESAYFSHYSEKGINGSLKIPCKRLEYMYPFVHRRVSDDGQGLVETLNFMGYSFYSIYVEEPPYSLTDPYMQYDIYRGKR